MAVELRPHQQKAIDDLSNGKILWGGVGAGKTMAAIGYYIQKEKPRDIIVITTAKKRDSLDWEGEAVQFGISTAQEFTQYGALLVESWNNIDKFVDYRDCFFIFDEQRLVGNGAWVKAFLKIVQNNTWIMLSATPGDSWIDYIPVFLANGYYKNPTQFKMRHVLYEPFTKFPKVKGYLDEEHLHELKNEVLVEMPYEKHTIRHLNWLECEYDKELMDIIMKRRWNPYDEEPIRDVAELFRLMRKVANSDPTRLEMLRKLLTCHDRLVVYYTFNYELEILRGLSEHVAIAEWNGHKKQPIPDTDKWVYLVQYVAGAEGWNCTSTNAMVLYSSTYSYKNHEQAQGRIDRLDTPFVDLYYYLLTSNSKIDVLIREALQAKKSFQQKSALYTIENPEKTERKWEDEKREFGDVTDLTEGYCD